MKQQQTYRKQKRFPATTLATQWRPGAAIGIFLALTSVAIAHPIPDVPLRSFFEADGSAVIKIELDTRCFSQDPEMEPYLLLDQYLRLSDAERDQLRARAQGALCQADRATLLRTRGGSPAGVAL